MSSAHRSPGSAWPSRPGDRPSVHVPRPLGSVPGAAAGVGALLLVLASASACDNRVAVQPADVVVTCFDADDCFEKGRAAEDEPSNPDPAVTSDKYARAAAYYEEGCGDDHGPACVSGAMIFLMGISGVTQDQAKAIAMMDRACDVGHAEGCFRLGEVYEDGMWGVGQDRALALEYFETACDAGSRNACRGARRVGG